MKLSEAMAMIEKRIPLSWAEPWDNPGLAAGDPEAEITKVALALDATPASAASAAAAGCELLVTHHPLIFHPLKSVRRDDYVGRTLFAAIGGGLSIYAAHTNWDSSPEGVNFVLSSLLDLKEVAPLVPSLSGAWGMGAVGRLAEPLSLSAFSELLRERWRLSNFTMYGDGGRLLERVALGGGACQEFWREARSLGADCFVTADFSYHYRQEALDAGLALVSADHGEMERASLPALRGVVEAETGLPVHIIDEVYAPFFHGRG
ncbi:MAG: Nif3-like dinuclear metal center hexameric protein [Synergistaceae bacterium]|nr:Nif3-like dinuclear metal center hexameric protein [Synergistaceae bacterium]